MRYNRVIIAKVALGVATEDEVFWINKCQKSNPECAEAVQALRELAKVPSTILCLDDLTLIRAGDTNKVSREENEHLMGCHRCARIGQYISNMPNPESDQDVRPLSASA